MSTESLGSLNLSGGLARDVAVLTASPETLLLALRSQLFASTPGCPSLASSQLHWGKAQTLLPAPPAPKRLRERARGTDK